MWTPGMRAACILLRAFCSVWGGAFHRYGASHGNLAGGIFVFDANLLERGIAGLNIVTVFWNTVRCFLAFIEPRLRGQRSAFLKLCAVSTVASVQLILTTFCGCGF